MKVLKEGFQGPHRIDTCQCGSVVEWNEKDAKYWKSAGRVYRYCICPRCDKPVVDPDFMKRQDELCHQADLDDLMFHLSNKFRWPWERKKKEGNP